jgi:hypothetical protein
MLMLTEGLNWPEKQHRAVDVDGGRRRTDGVGEEAAAEVLLAPGLRGSTRSGATKVPLGLGRKETRRRSRIAAAEPLTGGGVQSKSGRCTSWSRVGIPRKAS